MSTTTVSGRVDSAFDKLKEELETRSDIRKAKARKIWREMCQKMAAGGELNVSELSKLEDAARDLEIKPDDLHDRFTGDIEILQKVDRHAKELIDFEKKVAKFDQDGRAAADEVERLTTKELPRLRGEIANNQAWNRGLCATKAEHDRTIKENPDLFDSPEA